MSNAADPVQQFLFSSEKQTEEGQPTGFEAFMGYTEDPGVIEPDGLIETFKAGVSSGAEQLAADSNYFRALFNTVTGDTEEAAESIRKAETQRARSQIPLSATEKFGEFLEEPTISGFFTQVAKATGQITPSAVSTIGSGFTAGLAALFGKKLLGKTAKDTAERVVRDSIARTAAGTATTAETALANEAYKTFQRGAITGAFGSEFVPLAGSNLSEALDSGRPLDEANAYRAAAVALPQATIGVAAEATILKLVGDVAKKRGAKDGLMKALAEDVGKTAGLGAVAEGGAELLQDSIAIANRMDMDETYTNEEAKLRLAESTFAGFFGGGGIAAAGGAGGSVFSNRGAIADSILDSDPIQKAANVSAKAQEYLDQARQFRNNQKINEQQYGNTSTGNTTPESRRDINAQLVAITDPSSTKNSVWDAGNEAQHGARTNAVSKITINGTLAFAAFIPGRGTIVSTDQDTVKKVIQEQASDQVLGEALGYSGAKEGNLVVRVQDKDGNIIHEELTTEANMARAQEVAEGIKPDGGTVLPAVTAEKALEERKARLDREKGPEISPMDVPDDVKEAFGSRQLDEAAMEDEVLGEFNNKTDPNKVFPNTESARAQYDEEFGQTDWSDPYFASMTEALLLNAVKEQQARPNQEVTIEQTDNGYVLRRSGFEQDLQDSDVGFLEKVIQKAKQSKFARGSKVVVMSPDGTTRLVNLADLTNAGKRLVGIRGDSGFQGNSQLEYAQKGIREILADLRLEGYDVLIGGKSIFEMGNNIPADMDVTAARADGRNVKLSEALGLQKTVKKTVPAFAVAYDLDANGNRVTYNAQGKAVYDGKPAARITGSDAALDAFEKSQTEAGREVERFDPDQMPETEDQAEGIGDTQRMAAQPFPLDDGTVDPDMPQTQLDLEEGRTSNINRERATVDNTADFEFFNLSRELGEMAKNLVARLKIKKPVAFYNTAELSKLSDNQLAEKIPNDVVRAEVKKQLANMMANPDRKGLTIHFGNLSVILVEETGNPLADALVATHEVGHVLLKEEQANAVTNKALRNRLLKAYQAAVDAQNSPEAYNDSNTGFDEWYADQVAIYAREEVINKKKAGIVARHFEQVIEKLRNLYRSMSREMKKRFGKQDRDFQAYMDDVLQARKENITTAQNDNPGATVTHEQKTLVQGTNEAIVAVGGEALAQHWKRKVASITSNKKVQPLMKIVRSSDAILRSVAGSKIADMFYVRSQETGKGGNLGMLRAANLKTAELQKDFEQKVGNLNDADIQAALIEAATSDATDTLSPKAKEIRKFLEDVYDNYIEPSNTDIAKRENYFPVALLLDEIAERPDEFFNIVMENDPNAYEPVVRQAIRDIQAFRHSITDDSIANVDPTNPAANIEEAIRLTELVDRGVLQERGFLQSPDQALVTYLRHVVKRVEFNKHTGGQQNLNRELNKLNEEDRELAKDIIATYMGYTKAPLNPWVRQLNSWGQLIQFVTILPFAALASVPDLAGPVINSKEFSGLETGLKTIVNSIKNRAEAKQFARDIGVVTNEAVSNVWITQSEQDYMTDVTRSAADVWFKYTGLEFFTQFSREFASGMGVQFVIKHAKNETNNPRSERYLADLGLTAADVNAWVDSGKKLTTPEGKKVKQAIQRFVESSIMRPNAAERPIWASDPNYALVWQLKSFFYAYGKTIIGGIMRETSTRVSEAGTSTEKLAATTSILALTAIATMPLAMLGLELREYAKYGLAAVLPGIEASDRYFRSDRMDTGSYLTEIFERSGFLGPLTMGTMMHQQSEWGGGPIDIAMPVLGPTAEMITEILENGFDQGKTFKNRLIPIYNQL